MASLLGGEYCIYSLRRDVNDIQAILDDVHSRVGLVKYQSWKFPDKASSDIDVQQLLDRCHYNEKDEEECQMSHIILYDILIDRLVYLLQSFTCFNEVLLNVEGSSIVTLPNTKKAGSMKSMSVGLTVKKCWGRITQTAVLLQKLAKEVSSRCDAAESGVTEVRSSKQFQNGAVFPPNCNSRKQIHVLHGPVSAGDNDKDISCDNHSTGCQTDESVYANCENCLRTQSSLYDVGRAIVDLCKVQNLPTALEDFITRCDEKVPMSVSEILRWGKHQTKDLSRVSRHMTSLVNQVTPLKEDLSAALKNGNHAKSQLKICQSVYDRKEEELREEFRRREYGLNETEKELRKKIESLKSVNADMQDEADRCQLKISDLKDDLLQRHRDHLSMENTMSQLKEEAVEGRQYKQDAVKFMSELSRVNAELENLKLSLSHDKKLYDKEQTKNENLEHREKILQEKQRMLIARMEVVNEESEKLRDHILVIEEERDVALSTLKALEINKNDEQKTSQKNPGASHRYESEVDSLHENIKFLQGENEKLKSAVMDFTERERLVVAYPDLNQPNVASPMVQGSGDVLTDMRNQIQANKIRVQILEKENVALLKTLQKVEKDMPRMQPSSIDKSPTALDMIPDKLSEPIQLWKMTKSEHHVENFDRREFQTDDCGRRESLSSLEKSPPRQLFSKPPSLHYKTNSHGAPIKLHKRPDVPELTGDPTCGDAESYLPSSRDAYRRKKQQESLNSYSGGQPRQSFVVGSGRRAKFARPFSAKSALSKPWT